MWLYVPNLLNETSSPSVLGSEGLNSESASLSIISERLAGASAMWRGSALLPRAWSHQWKRGGFIRLLSGLTCSPSTLDLGVASFISSLQAIPAKTTALPESVPDHAESDSSLPKSAVSPTSAGLILSSAKTYRGTQMDNSQPSSRHWSDWATALRQEYSARPKPVIPCDANDCSSWPSAKVARGGYEVQRDGTKVLTLEGAASEWMAPVADDTGTRTKRYGQGGMALSMQASMWSSPLAQNYKGSSQGSMFRKDGKSRDDNLCFQAEQFFHPPSYPGQPIAGGSTSSTDSPNSNQPSVKRKLNPIFVEALMRWPTGLSGFERREMALTQWWQLQRSFLSELVLASGQIDQMELFA